MKKFEVGKVYSMASPCSHDTVWSYVVLSRTAKTVTLSDGNTVQKCRISGPCSEYSGRETLFPLGRYSMAPCLRA